MRRANCQEKTGCHRSHVKSHVLLVTLIWNQHECSETFTCWKYIISSWCLSKHTRKHKLLLNPPPLRVCWHAWLVIVESFRVHQEESYPSFCETWANLTCHRRESEQRTEICRYFINSYSSSSTSSIFRCPRASVEGSFSRYCLRIFTFRFRIVSEILNCFRKQHRINFWSWNPQCLAGSWFFSFDVCMLKFSSYFVWFLILNWPTLTVRNVAALKLSSWTSKFLSEICAYHGSYESIALPDTILSSVLFGTLQFFILVDYEFFLHYIRNRNRFSIHPMCFEAFLIESQHKETIVSVS